MHVIAMTRQGEQISLETLEDGLRWTLVLLQHSCIRVNAYGVKGCSAGLVVVGIDAALCLALFAVLLIEAVFGEERWSTCLGLVLPPLVGEGRRADDGRIQVDGAGPRRAS